MHKDIVIALLDWPFLLTVLLTVILVKFRKQVGERLSHGDIQLSWGEGKSIQLRELSDNLDMDLQPIQDDLEGLKQEVATLRKKLEAADGQPVGFGVAGEPESEPSEPSQPARGEGSTSPVSRMREALGDKRFRWRSLERLASVGGLNEQEAIGMLSTDPDVVLGTDKYGRRIAKQKGR